MADDTVATASLSPDPPPEPSLPPPKKRRRTDAEGGDLKRVAEVVMVLAAMGQMRGGREPSPAERSLVAEARRKLAAMCESLRPNDLFTSDAARVIAGDLGFSHQMGNRSSRKVSIAEKFALTKKKMMAEPKELLVQTPPQYLAAQPQVPVPKKVDQRAVVQQHGPQRMVGEKPGATPQTVAGFQTVLGHSVMQALNMTWKQMPFGESQHSVAQMRMPAASAGKDSAAALIPGRGDVAHFRGEVGHNEASRPSMGHGTSGNHLPEKSISTHPVVSSSTVMPPTKSAQFTTQIAQNTPSKVDSSSHSVNLSQKTIEEHNSRKHLQAMQGNASIGEHFSQSASMSSSISNSHEIARSILKILQPKAIDLTSWTPPSVDYMSHPINCQICKINITDLESLLVCDICEKGVHLKCLKTFNQKSLANADWHCPKCVFASNGKTLPPKYGKVTRSGVASKSSTNSGGTQVFSEKKPAIPDPKINQPRVTTGVKTRSSLNKENFQVNANSMVQTVVVPVVLANDCHVSGISSNSIGVKVQNMLEKESSADQINDKCSLINDSCNITSCSGDELSSQHSRNAELVHCSLRGPISEFPVDVETPPVSDISLSQTVVVPVIVANDFQVSDISSNCTRVKVQKIMEESCADNANDKCSSINDSHNITSSTGDELSSQISRSAVLVQCSLREPISEFLVDVPESAPSTKGMSAATSEVCHHPENGDVSEVINKTGFTDSMSLDTLTHIEANCMDGEQAGGNISMTDNICGQNVADDVDSICMQDSKSENINSVDKEISHNFNSVVKEISHKSEMEELFEQKGAEFIEVIGVRSTITTDNEDEAKGCKLPPFPDLHDVEWVGEAMKREDSRVYYQSCRINGITYNLQDYVILPSDGNKLSPSKLQVLWEDIGNGSKWATVNRYYFLSDISETVPKPSDPEDNEVYESNDTNTTEAGRILGSSIVVSLTKFSEESELQAFIADQKAATCPIFFCRWFYDKINGLFRPVTS